jgi:hypothetical protein
MTKKKPKREHKEVGRPSVMTKEVVEKLEWAFRRGFNDEEASFHAGIDKGTLYNYCHDNPDFSTRKEMLKRSLIVRSKELLAESIDSGEVNNAKWLLERKAKDEYSLRNELTGKDGEKLIPDKILRDDI